MELLKYINEVNKQFENEADIDGWGTPRAWIELPNKRIAEITLEGEDGYYSALIHGENGCPMLPMINAHSLNDLLDKILRENIMEQYLVTVKRNVFDEDETGVEIAGLFDYEKAYEAKGKVAKYLENNGFEDFEIFVRPYKVNYLSYYDIKENL